jgi:hypothetical protein
MGTGGITERTSVDGVDEMEPKGKATTNGVEETNSRVVQRGEQEKALSGDFLRGLLVSPGK